jgi:hypothetical protein
MLKKHSIILEPIQEIETETGNYVDWRIMNYDNSKSILLKETRRGIYV